MSRQEYKSFEWSSTSESMWNVFFSFWIHADYNFELTIFKKNQAVHMFYDLEMAEFKTNIFWK